MSEELITQSIDGCVTLVLDRPEKRNALSGDLVEALIQAVDDAHANQAETVVFRGNGKNFSAGFDFSGWQEQSEGNLVLRFIRIEILLQKVATLPALTVALAHGRNFGAAVDLFGVCDMRICSQEATFRMPGLKFGLVLGIRRFAACVGDGVARRILSSARTFDASEAFAIGFATHCAADTEWSQVIADAVKATPLPEPELLKDALYTELADFDLAQLVRSAAKPGLKARIASYLASAA